MKKKKRKKTRSFQRIIILKLSSVDQPWQPKFAQKIFMSGSWIFNSNSANVHISCFLKTPENQRLRIHWGLSTILATSNKSVWSMFLICKSMYILKVYSIHYRLRSNTNVKHLLSFFRQNDTKNVLLFLSRAPTRHSFPFNSWFLYELKRKVRLTKHVFDIFHFRFCFVFIKVYIFVQQNADSLTLKHHNFSQK